MTPARGSAEERRWFEAVAEIESCVLCGQYGTQVAHRNEGRGMGQKSAPWMTAALCPTCHHDIDNGKVLSQNERRELSLRAVVRTHDALIRNGRMVLSLR